MNKEGFSRFKNQLLGGAFLLDTSVFAEILGDVDFMFWREIAERAPYFSLSVDTKLDNVSKGRIILERLEMEDSPRRMAELLQAIYEAFYLYSYSTRNYGDSIWQTYTHRLIAEAEISNFSELEIVWIEEPETTWLDTGVPERITLPGILKITYIGEDWATEKSKALLHKGFHSKVLEQAINRSQEAMEVKKLQRRDLMDIFKSLLQIIARFKI